MISYAVPHALFSPDLLQDEGRPRGPFVDGTCGRGRASDAQPRRIRSPPLSLSLPPKAIARPYPYQSLSSSIPSTSCSARPRPPLLLATSSASMMNRVPPQAQTYGFPTAAGLPLPGQQQQQLPGRAMASPQPPNKGTLVPGQVLRVGKIQVTVERYLSEGSALPWSWLISIAQPDELADVLGAMTTSDRQAASPTSILSTRLKLCRAVGRMSSSASQSGIANCWMRSDGRSKSWCVGAARSSSGELGTRRPGGGERMDSPAVT
jgi:hypothetical protein